MVARWARLGAVGLVFLLAFAEAAWAWPPTWGAELTFTSPPQEKADHGATGNWPWSEANQEALERFDAVAKAKKRGRPDIKSVRLLEGHDKWGHDIVRVTYQDGWHFDVTMDPYCLEVITPPMTLAQIRRNRDRIQNDIFGWMAEAGLLPNRHVGGGHLHMGAASTFGDDVTLFRNFLVDHANHSELGLGAMEFDYANTSPFLVMNDSQRRKFADLIARADSGKFKSVRALASAFVAEVIFDGKPATGTRIMNSKYYQLNILRMAELDTWDTLEPNEREKDYEAWVLFDDVPAKARTAEWRHLRTQMSAEHLVEDVELLEGRMNYLRSLKKPLALSPDFLAGKYPTSVQATRRFYRFLVESGVDPAKYLERLPQEGDPNLADWRVWRREFQRLLRDCTAAAAALGEE